jgi:multiple sugar transport system substrate-binding protein
MYMKTSEKITAIILISFIIFWSVYIYYNDVDSIGEKEEESYKGIITMWDYPRFNLKTGTKYQWLQDRIRKFENENPGVYIRLEPMEWDEGAQKIEQAMETDELPDIIPLGSDFFIPEHLEPLNDYFEDEELDEFREGTIEAVMYNDTMVGVPFMMTTYVMYLNLDIFREKGVDPPYDGNWTYEEFIEKAEELTYDSDNDGLIDHFGFMSYIKPNYYNLWGIILSDGAKIYDYKKDCYCFYGDEAISGLNKIVKLKTEYKVVPDYFGIIDENESWDMFINQKNVAIYPEGSWALRVLNNMKKNGKGFNYGVANYPVSNSREPVSLSSGVGAYSILKQDDPKKRDMCIKFLKFIINDENQNSLEDLGVFAKNKAIDDMYKDDNNMKKIEESLDYVQIVPRNENWNKIDDIIQYQIKLAIIGEKSSEEAIEDAQKQVEQLTN